MVKVISDFWWGIFYCFAIQQYPIQISIFVSWQKISRFTGAPVYRCSPSNNRKMAYVGWALQAVTILVTMASEKTFWRPKFWRKSSIGDQQIKLNGKLIWKIIYNRTNLINSTSSNQRLREWVWRRNFNTDTLKI